MKIRAEENNKNVCNGTSIIVDVHMKESRNAASDMVDPPALLDLFSPVPIIHQDFPNSAIRRR